MIKFIRHIFFKKNMLPIYLILWITTRCNSKCQTCFNWKEQNTSNSFEKELDINEIRLISAGLNDIAWLLLGGGEPFLEPIKIAETAKIFYRQNNTRKITVSTNAILTDNIVKTAKIILDDCPELNLIITLSMDGVGQKHDVIRGYEGNFDCFVKTCSALEVLRHQYPRLAINLNTVVSNNNYRDLPEIIAFVGENLKPDFHGFELLRGDPRNTSLTPPPLDEYKEIFNQIKSYWEDLPFYSLRFSKIFKAAKILAREIELDILEQKKQLIPCFAGSITGVVTGTGEVHLCELLGSIGNIRDYGFNFKKLWLSDEADKLRRSIKAKKCYCAHSCFVSSSIMFNPFLYPKIFIKALRS